MAIGFFNAKYSQQDTSYFRRRWVRILAGAAAVLVITAIIDGFLLEPDWVVEELITVESKKLRKRIRIAHLSDLHIEGFGKRHERALDIIRKANPDIIVLTGDYLNGNNMQYLPELKQFVSQLKAPLGVFAVLGNFDFKQQPDTLFEEIGIHVLNNKSVIIEEADIVICGLACTWDLGKAEKKFLKNSCKNNPKNFILILNHTPNHIEEPAIADTDLYLCGHTHGGQVRLPIWGAIVTLSKLGKKYECGNYQRKKTHIYVNRGLGMEDGLIPRVRFLCRPEVALVDIIPDTD